NVGIGETSPGARLDVEGANDLNTTLSLQARGATTTGLVVTNAGNVGIGTTNPVSTLNLDGILSLKRVDITVAGGSVNDDFDVGNTSFARIGMNAPGDHFSITGITGGVDGRVLILYNTTAFNMTVKRAYNALASEKKNQIWTESSSKDIVTTGAGTVILVYDSDRERWVVISAWL
ncbi:MAG: hypothetical protein ABIH71_02225, partial [Candidatus Omnitrophota bacterium]